MEDVSPGGLPWVAQLKMLVKENPKNTSLSVDLSFCLNFSGGEGMTDDGCFFSDGTNDEHLEQFFTAAHELAVN